MATKPTLDQAAKLLELVAQSGRSLGWVQDELIGSGAFTDLLAVDNLRGVNRSDHKRVLGLGSSVFSVKMSGAETTDDIVSFLRANGFNYVNDYITQANFPLAATDGEDIEIEIIDPNRSFSEKDGLRFLAEVKLERPTYQQALRFAQQHGCWAMSSTKKPFVIFLHEAWQDSYRSRRILHLRRGPSRRELVLSYPDHRFYALCVLAGVRSRKQSSAA